MALTTRRRALTTLGAALAGAVVLPASQAWADPSQRGPHPLWNAHAHNDYEHPRPLFDALDHRFNSVEADIFLVGDQLLIGHDSSELDPSRTLESLYLDPLAARVRADRGSVYRGWRRPLQLLIDIKTEGSSTYLELDRHLRTCSPGTRTAACTPDPSPPSSPATAPPASRWRRRTSGAPSTTAGSPTSAAPPRPLSSR